MEKDLATAIVAFGRFQVPTLGHYALFEKVRELAKEYKGDPFVFCSHTKDKKRNPISYKDKIDFLNKYASDVIVVDYYKIVKNIFDLLKFIHRLNCYDRVIVVTGSDRTDEYYDKLNKYNGIDYSFAEIKIEMAGNEELRENYSGTRIRALALKKDWEGFRNAFYNSDEKWARHFYDSLISVYHQSET